jgi:mRNA interferase RelE/StbE
MSGAWVLTYSSEAQKDVASLDGSDRRIVEASLIKLTTDPHLRGHALGGNLTGFRSLVVGKKKIRIVFKVINDKVTIFVIAIGHRRNDEVYLQASARLGDSPEG